MKRFATQWHFDQVAPRAGRDQVPRETALGGHHGLPGVLIKSMQAHCISLQTHLYRSPATLIPPRAEKPFLDEISFPGFHNVTDYSYGR